MRHAVVGIALALALLWAPQARAQVPAPVGGDMTNTTVKATGATTARKQGDRAVDMLTPLDFGAKGDGTTDDTNAVQLALNHGGSIQLGPHIYAINSTGLNCSKLVNVSGTQGNQPLSPSYGTVSGFRPMSPNITLLTLQAGCSGSILEKFSIDDGAAGTNTSGAAILINGAANVTISDVAINAPCIGMDISGNTIKVDRAQITQVAGSACGDADRSHDDIGNNG